MIVVRWTGAAGLEISHGERTYLLDPYHSRLSKWTLLTSGLRSCPDVVARYLASLPGTLSALAGGHTHFDHVLDFPEIAPHVKGPVIGSASLDTLLTLHGQPHAVEVARGRAEIPLPGDDVTLTMIPSRHGLVAFGRDPYPGDIDWDATLPLRVGAYRHGDVFLMQLALAGRSLLVIDSADLIDDELAGTEVDAIFVCVPGWRQTPEFLPRLFRAVTTKTVVAYHFDDFTRPWTFDRTAPPLPLQAIPEFIAEVRRLAPKVEVIVPRPYEVLHF